MLLRFCQQLLQPLCPTKPLAPALIRTRVPSWLMRLTFTTSLSTNDAITCVNNSSSASP
jgi:hypothetical protein